MKYKAVISDIDGTLTPIIPHSLPSKKVSLVIKKITDSGIFFSVASGRPFSLVEYLTKHLHLSSPAITDNGAVINKADGSILWEALLPNEEASKILSFTRGFKLTRLSCETCLLDNPKEIPESAKIRKISVHDIPIEASICALV